MFTQQQNKSQNKVNSDHQFKNNNKSQVKQSKWTLQKYKEESVSLEFHPALSPTACTIILMSRFISAAAGQTNQHISTSSEQASSLSIYNSTQSGNLSILPTNFSNMNFPGSNPVIPEILLPPKKVEKKITSPKTETEFILTKPNIDIPVEAHPDYQSYLNTLSPEDELAEQEKIKIMTEKVKNMIPELNINPQVLANIKKTNMTIFLMHNMPDMLGFYSPYTNSIKIGMTDLNLRIILRNEFHHASIAARNFDYAKKNDLPLTPGKTYGGYLSLNFDSLFFNKEGPQKNQVLELMIADKEFKDNLRNFETFAKLIKLQEKLTHQQASFYFKLSEAIIKHHTPGLYPVSYTIDEYNQMQSDGHIQKTYPDNSVYLSKKCCNNAPYHVHFYPDAIQSTKGKVSGHFNFAHPDDAESKIISFLHDWENFNARYSTGFYSTLSTYEKLLEFSSEIDMMAPEIKTILAPKWCAYLSKFHEVKNYCSPRI